MAGKPLGVALDGRIDSFVVETDVCMIRPTDVNLLWDAGTADGVFPSVADLMGCRDGGRGSTNGTRFGKAINGCAARGCGC